MPAKIKNLSNTDIKDIRRMAEIAREYSEIAKRLGRKVGIDLSSIEAWGDFDCDVSTASDLQIGFAMGRAAAEEW